MIVEALRVVGVAGALLLIGAGVGHTRSPAQLRALLRAHGIAPKSLVVPLARTLGPAQLLLGAAVLVGVAAWPPLAAAAGAASALLFAGFAVYLTRLVGSGQPCGCFGDDAPTGPFAVTRAVLLTAGAIGLVLRSASPTTWLTIGAAVLFAAVLWLAPQIRWATSG